jgi:hypothetical protein
MTFIINKKDYSINVDKENRAGNHLFGVAEHKDDLKEGV